MQRIVRKAGPKGAQVLKLTRGPFVTGATIFDGGRRLLVVELHDDHMVLRQIRRRGSLRLSYEEAWAFAWKRQLAERARLKKERHSK